MFNIITKEINWNGQKLKLETGRIARQAHGSVLVSLGETIVLCTVVASKQKDSELDFLALTVNYQEKFYASGRIPGGFIKRETKATEAETLTSRLIDRSLRPLFPKNYYNEIQVICTVLSYDAENEAETISLIGASAALWLSGLPLSEPVAAARVGYKQGEFYSNPNRKQVQEGKLDLIVSGTADSIIMVESEAAELSSDIMLEAISYGHEQLKPVIELIKDFANAAGVDNTCPRVVNKVNNEFANIIDKNYTALIESALDERNKKLRNNKLDEVHQRIVNENISAHPENLIKDAFSSFKSKLLRNRVLESNIRLDGRGVKEIRSIDCLLDLLPKVHGSALFTRGETQALAVTTVGTAYDEQMSEDLAGTKSDNLILHYNFPPYSVGEVGVLKAPGRREIGHGKLALKALKAVLPSKQVFPYTVRIVSDITESNGSSSMATVCSSSLSLMAAGIPIKKHVAGIAMGLVKDNDNFVVLSDIMGDEDHLGDMDFKVAATDTGITALQMDIKVLGISHNIMKTAIKQAEEGIEHILKLMKESIEMPRKELSPSAPRIVSININKDKIREVIGTGGKKIREICEQSGAKIEIDDSGKITISAPNQSSIDTAVTIIEGITTEPEIGQIYQGRVVKITDFGAFIRFLNGIEGLLHISEIAEQRIESVSDFLSENDNIEVKVIGIDKNGKPKLSMKSLNKQISPSANPSSNRQDRPRNPSYSRPSYDDKAREQGNNNSGGFAKKKRFF